ncbi:penicillin-binding protein 1B [Pleionea sediminis]|uniref:penicillin-binding protein 1B n=1 Tax=Pleionea sediminis TaxID=2569479 RepID=UPI001184E48D|nr:penicillin-binding protein 1B [Pleionea sediminis]
MGKKNTKWPAIKQFIIRLSIIGSLFFIGLIIYSDAEIQTKFATNRWLVPAKVYARSKNLLEGERTQVEDLLWELRQLNYRKVIKATQPGEFEQYQSEFIIFVRSFPFSEGFIASRKIRVVIKNGIISESRIIDGSNEPARLDPLFIDRINPLVSEDRELVKLDKVPPLLVDALILSEDRSFFEHMGISFKGIGRALSQNLSEGRVTQGGSTLTQQLVKNYFLTNERTLWRKFREAIMAVTLEARYSKDEILQAYLNEVYLGQDGARAIHGFAKASRFYFDRDISQLNLSQIATLVALVRGPSFYDPRRHQQRALERRNLILNQMLEFKAITEQQMQLALQRSLQVVPKSQSKVSRMPAAIGMVRRQLKQHYSLEQLQHHDLSVFTTIDPRIQFSAEQALKERISWLTNNYPSVPKNLQGATVVSDRLRGDVLAVVGDRDPGYAGFNRAIDAYRQTGSAIKPFVYLTALQRASKFSLVTKVEDKPFTLTATDGSEWTPQNYDKEFQGEVTLAEAMTHSYNLSTARLALDVGIENVIDNLYEFGFSRKLYAFPSFALGAQEMSPWELLKLYQVISSNGLKVESNIISSVIHADGKTLDRYPSTAEQVVSPEVIYLTSQLLRKVVQEGTASSLNNRMPNYQVVGKTGTTDGLKDSWFVGFSARYLAVVWVGVDNNEPALLTGASGAMRVWGDLILSIENEALELRRPKGIVTASSGWFADCVPFIAGYLPESFSECDE